MSEKMESYASYLEESEENNKFFIRSLVLTMWMYYIRSSTIQFNWFEPECVDLSYRRNASTKEIN